MTLSYESTLEDLFQPAARYHIQSRTYQKNLIHYTITSIIVCALVFHIAMRLSENEYIWYLAPIGGLLGALIGVITNKSNVRTSIRKNLKNEIGHRLPCTTTYQTTDDSLSVEYLGICLSFQLAELTLIREDKGYLELWFGDLALCTIPLRAFESPAQQVRFIEDLQFSPAP